MNRRARTGLGAAAAAGLVLSLIAGCSANPAVEHPVPNAGPTAGPSGDAGSSSSAAPSPPARPEPPPVPIQGTELAPAAAVSAPVRVVIPAADIDVAIAPVGVLDSGVMELPADVDVAGWYRFGSDPASAAGATVLAAHVDSLRYGRGPFSRLRDLGAGALITVTTADGASRDYTLSSNERVSKQEIPLESVFDHDGPPHLVLITCGGVFDHGTGHYLDNILVTATPVAG